MWGVSSLDAANENARVDWDPALSLEDLRVIVWRCAIAYNS